MKRYLRGAVLGMLTIVGPFVAISGQTAQNQTDQSTKPEVKKVPAPHVSAASGKEMYVAYCASCHGLNGTGDGPAAAAMKTPPANLTLLASKNGGSFPYAKVQQAIKGDANMPSAHGSQQMPVWGTTLRRISQNSQAETQLRIRNIADYIASLQQK